MSSTVKERIKVDELSKFGFKVGAEYVNFSKHLPEGDKTNVVPGAEFEAELFVADSGKRYLNKIIGGSTKPYSSLVSGAEQHPHVDEVKLAAEKAKKPFMPKFQKKEEVASDKMSKSEWQAKDRSQLIGGLSHDAAAITASLVACTAVDDPLKLYKSLLEGMLKIRDEVK